MPYLKTAVAGIIVGLFAAFSLHESAPVNPNDQLVNATVFFGQTRAMPDFALQADDNGTFGPEALQDRWSVLFVGYTHCPDICPITMSSLRGMMQALPASISDKVQVVMVSVDPERDTPEHLASYVTFFDERFIGVTGSHAQLSEFTRAISAVYRVDEHEPGATDYLVDHSSHLAIINPLGRFHGILSAPHEAEQMAADMKTIVEAY